MTLRCGVCGTFAFVPQYEPCPMLLPNISTSISAFGHELIPRILMCHVLEGTRSTSFGRYFLPITMDFIPKFQVNLELWPPPASYFGFAVSCVPPLCCDVKCTRDGHLMI